MAVSASFRTLVLDQLGRVLPNVRARRMFGGVGLYAGELFFALIADDVVYLKADDTTRPAFEGRGMGPFRPYGPGGAAMQYYQLPEELLEDAEALRPWVDDAIGVARRAKTKRA
jgi:DNA transformation protein